MKHVVVVAVVFAAALAAAGCGADAEVSIGEESLDQQAIEETVSTGLGEQANLPAPEVDCEGIEDVDVQEGGEFTCTGTAENGDEFPIEITLTDDEGGYRYQVPADAGSGRDGNS